MDLPPTKEVLTKVGLLTIEEYIGQRRATLKASVEAAEESRVLGWCREVQNPTNLVWWNGRDLDWENSQ